MILANAYSESETSKIKQTDTFCIVDKDENPDKYLKSIMLLMNTKQAKQIRDNLIKQIDEYSDNRVGVGIIIHTGLCS